MDAIRELVDAANRHQKDVDEFIALHHPDAVIVNIAGRRVLGRDALRAAMAGAMDSPLAKVRTHLEIEDVRLLRPDVALVSCAKRVYDERDGDGGGPELPARAVLTFTAVREADGWKIALAQTTPAAARPAAGRGGGPEARPTPGAGRGAGRGVTAADTRVRPTRPAGR